MARRRPFLLALLAGALLVPASSASAAEAPQVKATWVTEVTATSANLRAEINPEGLPSTYRFEYLPLSAYEANLKAAKEGFAGAAKAPLSGAGAAGSGTTPIERTQHIGNLPPATAYRFRLQATNEMGTTIGPERTLATQAPTNAFALLDNRGWEMVSPADKNGGAIQAPEAIFGGGVFQAASNGQSLTYSSADSFAGGQGAPAGSQYVARRAAGGWSTQNITTPLLAASYGQHPDGVPYRLFSQDLSRALLSNGQRCRTEVGQCPVANPPLPGSGAVAGYRDYYLREANGSFASLLSSADLAAHTTLGPEQFELTFAGATPDLTHVVLSSCAALSTNAIEVAGAEGCDPAKQNLYLWSGSGFSLLNLAPGDSQGTPGATLAAPAAAISTDANRIYWSEAGNLYLRDGAQSRQADEAQGGGGVFQTASTDGRYAFFTKAAHLYRYDAVANAATDLTPTSEVKGVLGASADGTKVYYLSTTGLFLWDNGTTTEVAKGAAAINYPPALGTARTSADGAHLLFLSAAELTGYESNGRIEAFLYGPPPGGGSPKLICISCNPTGERPQGAASIPGALANGSAELYKPRALSASANRAFFESEDELVPQDSNNKRDVYEWEAQGEGNCTREGGCVQLISSGRGTGPSSFIDASADGSDAFFLTDASLAFGDPGSYDLYDARVGGGFPAPPNFISCDGDACQALPEAPEDPTPGTLVKGPGNPALAFAKVKDEKKGKAKKKHHKKKGHHSKKGHKHGGKK